MANNTNDIFNKEFSRRYDEYNDLLNAVSNNLRFLISVLLRHLPVNARILCVGVGTGTEISSLARQHSGWSFTGIDPSPDMLAVCAEKMYQEGCYDRCTLIEGYLSDVPATGRFDAVLCLLVTHFIQEHRRLDIYEQMNAQLVPGGSMIVAEIAGDMGSSDFDEMLVTWAGLHSVASNIERDPEEIRSQMIERLLLLPPAQTERLISEAGFSSVQQFFQSLLIHGWVARKPLSGSPAP